MVGVVGFLVVGDEVGVGLEFVVVGVRYLVCC